MANSTGAAAVARGLSLHIGLNSVSGAAYGGWTGPLAACEFDANDMAAIAKYQGGFKGNYGNLHGRIKAGLPATQSPNLFTLGKAGVFLAQAPFSV